MATLRLGWHPFHNTIVPVMTALLHTHEIHTQTQTKHNRQTDKAIGGEGGREGGRERQNTDTDTDTETQKQTQHR